TDHPALGAVAGLLRPAPGGVLPYVSLPYITKEGAGGPPQPGFTGGWLGRSRDPLLVLRDPNSPDFAMPELGPGSEIDAGRLDRRRHLAAALACRVRGRPLQDMDD